MMNESRRKRVPYEKYTDARAQSTPGITLGIIWKHSTDRIRNRTAVRLTWKSANASIDPRRMPDTDISRFFTFIEDMY